jgi:hypothetical protein
MNSISSIRSISILGVCLLLLICPAGKIHAQKELRAEDLAEKPLDAFTIVGIGRFMFKADLAFPAGQPGSIDVTDRSNTVEIRGDTATGKLAFFGSDANAAYNVERGGINFNGEIRNKKLKLRKKRKNSQVIMKFSVKASRDNYDCTFIILQNGSTTLSVNSIYKSSISYYGWIYPLLE